MKSPMKFGKSSASVAPDASSSAYAVPEKVAAGIPKLAKDDRGVDWLVGFGGLFIRQKLELFEAVTSCETANRYTILPIALDTPIPEDVNSVYTYPLRAALDLDMPALHGREYGSCLQRVCCPLVRGFALDFVDADGTPYFGFDRPFRCEPCGCWPIFFTRSQNLSIRDKEGYLIGAAFEPVSYCSSCWTRTFIVMDAEGQPVYTLRASDCGTYTGCNFCAPSCFNESYDVDIFTPEGVFVGTSTFVWPGCSCAGLTDRSNLVVRFPEGSSATQRAALVGGMMLVDSTVMEVKRLQEGTGNTSSPHFSGSGGAPTSVEMER